MVLEIKKSAVSFEENELVELERIILDQDEAAAFQFPKKQVCRQRIIIDFAVPGEKVE